MQSSIRELEAISYLELLSVGTPAAPVAGALDLIGADSSAWVLAPGLAVVPALNPETLMICPPSVKESYWATEQALKSGAVQTVVLVLDTPYNLTQSRRFKLATEVQGTRLIVILPGSIQGFNSAAQERWHLVSKIERTPLTQWQQLKNKSGSLQQMEFPHEVRQGRLAARSGLEISAKAPRGLSEGPIGGETQSVSAVR